MEGTDYIIHNVSYACDRIAERPNWGLWGSSESSENKKEAAPILRLERQQEEVVFPVSKSWDQLLGMRNIMRTAYRSWDHWGRGCLVGPGTTEETTSTYYQHFTGRREGKRENTLASLFFLPSFLSNLLSRLPTDWTCTEARGQEIWEISSSVIQKRAEELWGCIWEQISSWLADYLEKEMAICSSILARKFCGQKFSAVQGGLQFKRSQRVGHNWATEHQHQQSITIPIPWIRKLSHRRFS